MEKKAYALNYRSQQKLNRGTIFLITHDEHMSIDLTTIRKQSIASLVEQARSHGIDNAGNMRKSDLIFALICAATSKGKTIRGDGVLEILGEGFGFLRSPVSDYGPGTDDIYVSPAQIRRFNLRSGDFIEGKARTPQKEGERYLALLQIESVNGQSPEESRNRNLFETFSLAEKSPLRFSHEVIQTWAAQKNILKGDRVLIRYTNGASCVRALLPFLQHHEVTIVYLSIETPSEDILVLENVGINTFVSPMGEGAARHLQVANLALMRAKRLAEEGEDVVLVFDSLWSYILCAQEQIEHQGKQNSFSTACSMFRFFWGAARQLQKGSLSIYALLPTAFSSEIARVESQILHQTHHELFLSLELEKEKCMPPLLVQAPQGDPVLMWKEYLSR